MKHAFCCLMGGITVTLLWSSKWSYSTRLPVCWCGFSLGVLNGGVSPPTTNSRSQSQMATIINSNRPHFTEILNLINRNKHKRGAEINILIIHISITAVCQRKRSAMEQKEFPLMWGKQLQSNVTQNPNQRWWTSTSSFRSLSDLLHVRPIKLGPTQLSSVSGWYMAKWNNNFGLSKFTINDEENLAKIFLDVILRSAFILFQFLAES